VRAHFKEGGVLPNDLQNGSSSTDRAIYEAEASKNSFTGEVEPC
jgi:hypothetical protein